MPTSTFCPGSSGCEISTCNWWSVSGLTHLINGYHILGENGNSHNQSVVHNVIGQYHFAMISPSPIPSSFCRLQNHTVGNTFGRWRWQLTHYRYLDVITDFSLDSTPPLTQGLFRSPSLPAGFTLTEKLNKPSVYKRDSVGASIFGSVRRLRETSATPAVTNAEPR